MTEKSNSEWLSALRADGQARDAALGELRALLFAAIGGFLRRRQAGYSALHPEELRQFAEDCTQEALLRVQSRLDGFRGESRFTTWAYSIAIRIALSELRSAQWRSKALEKASLGETPGQWPIDDPGPERSLEQRQARAALSATIDTALTPLQRKALIAHAFQDMPLDLVADWLGTNRNSLYKLIHDARKKLRTALLERGLSHGELIATFDQSGRGDSLTSKGKISLRHDVSR